MGKPSRFGLFRVRSPLLTESIFLSFPPVNEMFQFTGLAARHLWIQCLLIRVSRDQRLLDSYPELFAVFHALHRLLTPRHPPCALSSLTTIIQNSPHPRPACTAPFRIEFGCGNTTHHWLAPVTDHTSPCRCVIQSNDSSFVSPAAPHPEGPGSLDKR